jgi:hypothetical protein
MIRESLRYPFGLFALVASFALLAGSLIAFTAPSTLTVADSTLDAWPLRARLMQGEITAIAFLSSIAALLTEKECGRRNAMRAVWIVVIAIVLYAIASQVNLEPDMFYVE